MPSLKPRKDWRIHVLVSCYKRPEYTKRCLEAISEAQEYPNVNFHLANDGSDDHTPELFREFEKKYGFRDDCWLWHPKEQKGTWVWHNDKGKHVGLRNQIINFFSLSQGFPGFYQIICKIDNDCLVPPNWLNRILDIFGSHDIDILSPNVFPSNAAYKYGKKVNGLPYMPSSIVGGLWVMKSELIEDMVFQSHEVNGLTGAIPLLKQIIIEKEPKIGWVPDVIVQDLGHWTGGHPEHISSEEHRKYSQEVGREISW